MCVGGEVIWGFHTACIKEVHVRLISGDARLIESHEFLKLKFLVIHGWFYLSAVHTNDRLCINQPIDSQIRPKYR